MRALALADAHLRSPDSAAWRDLLAFLAGPATAGDLVVLAGDTFDFLVGRQRRALALYRPVIEAIEALADRRQVVVLEGNHDFHLRAALPSAVRVCEHFELDLHGVRTRWEHGDQLLPPWHYRLLRRVLRSEPVRVATERLPPALVWRLATTWSDGSRHVGRAPDPSRLAARLPAVLATLPPGVERLVSGHLHVPFRARGACGREWISLGAWLTSRSYLEIDSEGARLRSFAPEGSA